MSGYRRRRNNSGCVLALSGLLLAGSGILIIGLLILLTGNVPRRIVSPPTQSGQVEQPVDMSADEIQQAVSEDEITLNEIFAGDFGYDNPFMSGYCKAHGYSMDPQTVIPQLQAAGVQFDRLFAISHLLCNEDGSIHYINGIFSNLSRGSSPYVLWTFEGQLNGTCKGYERTHPDYKDIVWYKYACRDYSGYTGIAILDLSSNELTNAP